MGGCKECGEPVCICDTYAGVDSGLVFGRTDSPVSMSAVCDKHHRIIVRGEECYDCLKAERDKYHKALELIRSNANSHMNTGGRWYYAESNSALTGR